MGRIISIASQKGGVGKTTSSVNLAFTLSAMGYRTLLVDLDPQGGTTIAINLREFTELGLVDLLQETATKEDALAATEDGGITMLGIGRLAPENMPYFEQAAWDGRLGDLLLDVAEPFDYTVFDLPAGTGGVVHMALSISDGVIPITDCSSIALKSMPMLLEVIEHITSQYNADLRVEGVLLSGINDDSQTQAELYQELEATLPGGILFNTVVPRDERISRASLEAIPAALFPESEDIAEIYQQWANEILAREVGSSPAQ
ncbi:MAG: ParA family protein [Verrucomicrobiota bacterium]